jgi:hypothetical protein
MAAHPCFPSQRLRLYRRNVRTWRTLRGRPVAENVCDVAHAETTHLRDELGGMGHSLSSLLSIGVKS